MKKVLEIDGGGLRGIIPLTVCNEIEKATGKSIAKSFNLATGTSVGAIITASFAAGASAADLLDIFINKGAEIFDPRHSFVPFRFLPPIYSRESGEKIISEFVGEKTFGETEIDLLVTAYGICGNRTHFVKSWIDEHKNIKLIDAISWSALSGAYYFDKIDAPDYKWKYTHPDGSQTDHVGECFQDGGQGSENCTLVASIVESLSRKWQEKGDVAILSLGSGGVNEYTPYDQAKDESSYKQIIKFPMEARTDSSTQQLLTANHLCKSYDFLKIVRSNVEIPKEMNIIDGVRYIPDYVEAGKKAAKEALANPTFVKYFLDQ